MIIASGDIYARISDREQVTALMCATQERVREQPGCLYYAFAETLDDPGHFVVVAQWQDQGALDAHYRSEVFADYQAQVGVHLVRSSELRVFEASGALSVEPQPIDPQQDG
jgi:quinol monooxygenase YgiN